MADVTLSGNHVLIDGTLSVLGPDIKLSQGDRRKSSNPSGHRRALVHGFEDTLVMNYNNDYLGVEIKGGREGITLDGKVHIDGGELIATIASLKTKIAALEREVATLRRTTA